jgi:phosphohistidine phosphatase
MENKPIRLYLVRHGEARNGEEDSERSLTENGRQMAEKTASFLAKQHPRIDQIRHSGKKRAEETARIFAKHLSPSGGTMAIPGLAPNDDVEEMAEIVEHESGMVMLVGHLPFLNRLASLLLLNHSEKNILRISPGSVLSLNRYENGWELEWMLTPDLL